MQNQMIDFKATANAHMRRDLDAQGKWLCTCEACHAIRSLVGMDKALGVRDLVRQVLEVEKRLETEPDAAQKRRLMDDYLQLYDRLGDEMSK
jgi:hypothetical protein